MTHRNILITRHSERSLRCLGAGEVEESLSEVSSNTEKGILRLLQGFALHSLRMTAFTMVYGFTPPS